MMRKIIARTLTLVGAVFFWAWVIVRLVLDWVGRSTVVDDFNLFVERLPNIVGWLYATPWWVPAVLASLLTGFLIWLAWPEKPDEIVRKGLLALPAISDQRTAPASPAPSHHNRRRFTAYDLESRQKAVDQLYDLNDKIRSGTLEKATYLADNFWRVANEEDIVGSLNEIIEISETEFRAYEQALDTYMRRFSDFDENLRSSWNQYEFLDGTRQLRTEIFRVWKPGTGLFLYDSLNNNKYHASWVTSRNQLAELVLERRNKLNAQRLGYEKVEVISG